MLFQIRPLVHNLRVIMLADLPHRPGPTHRFRRSHSYDNTMPVHPRLQHTHPVADLHQVLPAAYGGHSARLRLDAVPHVPGSDRER